MIKHFLFFVSALFLLSSFPFSTSNAQESIPIRVGIQDSQPILRYMPLISAYHNGYFVRQNMAVEIVHFKDPQDMIEDLNHGDIDFAISYPLFTLVAQEYKLPIKILGVLSQGLLYSGYTKNPELADLQTLKDLKKLAGRKIGMLPDESFLGHHFNAFMLENKTLFKDVELVIAPLEQQQDLLEKGKIDIAIGIEPYLTQDIKHQKYYRSFPMTTFLKHGLYTVISGNINHLERNEPVAKAFLSAIEQAMISLSVDDPNIGIHVAQKSYPTWAEKSLKPVISFIKDHHVFPKNMSISQELWEQSQNGLLQSGYLLQKPRYDQAIDSRFFK